jgi:hypothetical protein
MDRNTSWLDIFRGEKWPKQCMHIWINKEKKEEKLENFKIYETQIEKKNPQKRTKHHWTVGQLSQR